MVTRVHFASCWTGQCAVKIGAVRLQATKSHLIRRSLHLRHPNAAALAPSKATPTTPKAMEANFRASEFSRYSAMTSLNGLLLITKGPPLRGF